MLKNVVATYLPAKKPPEGGFSDLRSWDKLTRVNGPFLLLDFFWRLGCRGKLQDHGGLACSQHSQEMLVAVREFDYVVMSVGLVFSDLPEAGNLMPSILLRTGQIEARQQLDVLIERDFRTGKHAHCAIEIIGAGEAASASTEVASYQFVANNRSAAFDGLKTEIANGNLLFENHHDRRHSGTGFQGIFCFATLRRFFPPTMRPFLLASAMLIDWLPK